MSNKILVIEDNEQDQKILKRYLNKAGYEDITIVDSGEKGVEAVKSGDFQLVVTDTNLPGINGHQACKAIKDLKGQSVKVIVMTGAVDAVDAVQAREMGADDYCVKTSDCGPIIEAVKNIFEK